METKLISIEFGEGQRMRRVVSRSNCRVTGKHPSWKRKCMAYWESPLERDGFRRLDADSLVVAYEEQPAKITYMVSGKTLTHFPDVLITSEGSHEFREIKTDRDAERCEIRERTAIMTDLLPRAGYNYRIWLESEIRTQPALNNDFYLITFGRHPVPIQFREIIRRLFDVNPSIPWGFLTRETGTNKGVEYISRLVLEGMLTFDRNTPLTPESLLQLDYRARSQS